MSWELTWGLDWKELRAERVLKVAQQVAATWAGTTVRVEVEDRDTISAFFVVPAALVAAAMEENGAELGQEGADLPEHYVLELSFYDLDQDGCVMSLEGEWSDNAAAWDAACQLADALADELDAEPLEL